MKFSYFYDQAIARHGSQQEIAGRLPSVAANEQIREISDDRILAEITRCVFRAGFAWQVIKNKWQGFEDAFAGFLPIYWQQVPPERLDELARDTRIVRNPQKIATVPLNARMIVEVAEQHGSFGAFLANWPRSEQHQLLAYLKKHGARLGGTAAQHVLRRVGWDGYLLTPDNLTALRNHKLLDASPYSKRGAEQIQRVFNQWHAETGMPYSHLSRILSMSIDVRG
ncbi:MAG: DNA-3-methyladenine glycosylase I [Gammaproteobacteria bacterium]|jgi:3-methyladenine DNA glycosylase Tag|nr:DNA-3-methyladenine glycosylase I [Gammaproteobacteria bacterium]